MHFSSKGPFECLVSVLSQAQCGVLQLPVTVRFVSTGVLLKLQQSISVSLSKRTRGADATGSTQQLPCTCSMFRHFVLSLP